MSLSPSDKCHYAMLFSVCLQLLLSQFFFVSRIQLFSYLYQCHIIHNICRQLGDSRNVLYDLTIFLFLTFHVTSYLDVSSTHILSSRPSCPLTTIPITSLSPSLNRYLSLLSTLSLSISLSLTLSLSLSRPFSAKSGSSGFGVSVNERLHIKISP